MVDLTRKELAINGGKPYRETEWLDNLTFSKEEEAAAVDTLSLENIWVKRPGTGSLLAKDFQNIMGKKA